MNQCAEGKELCREMRGGGFVYPAERERRCGI